VQSAAKYRVSVLQRVPHTATAGL